MNAVQIAKNAVDDTQQLSMFVSPTVRELAAIGKAALAIAEDKTASGDVRAYRLEESILEIRTLLAQA